MFRMREVEIRACIFDLDGVIVDTAKYHFSAWRRLANSLGFDFTEAQNETLKGVSRMKSLELILEMGGVEKSEEERIALAAKKNDWYLELINEMDESEILPGIQPFLDGLQAEGIKIGLGSASKNAPTILDKVGLTSYFETIIDGSKTTKGKPHPQVFLLGAEALGVSPENVLVFEDAPKGVEAAKAGGMFCIGIGEQEVLGKADYVMPGFDGVDTGIFEKLSTTVGTDK